MVEADQAVLQIDRLPAGAVSAAAEFHAEWLPGAVRRLREECRALVLVLPPATYEHNDWRRAVVRDLAREHAPQRINMIAGQSDAEIAAALDYLAKAPGVTGQYLVLACTGAGHVADVPG